MPHLTMAADMRGDGRSVLKWDSKQNILAAHCQVHGQYCRLNRTLKPNPRKPAQGRCGGFWLAWLACARDYPDQYSHHEAALADLAPFVEKVDLAHRETARGWACENSAELVEFLSA